MDSAENVSGFISVLQKMVELYEEEGESAVLIDDIRMLLLHFELNTSADGVEPYTV